MANATVFVDDAVRGDLPRVCAKTGVPTTKRMIIRRDLTGSLGALWLAVLFGPIGWLLLLVVAASRKRTVLVVRVPWADDALLAYARAARRTLWCVGLTIAALAACIGLTVLFPAIDRPSVALAVLAVVVVGAVATGVSRWTVDRLLVGVDLDASGRWVILRGVHPAFASACEAAAPGPADAAVPAPR